MMLTQRASEIHAKQADAAAQVGNMEEAVRLNMLATRLLTASVFYAAAQYYGGVDDERMKTYATARANAEYVEAVRLTNPAGVVH